MEFADLSLMALAFLLSAGLALFSIKRLGILGIVSDDLHKSDRPKRPRVGGIGIAAAFTIAMVAAYLLKNSFALLIILLAFLAEAAIGLIDDLLRFMPWRKLILASFGAIPLLLLIKAEPISILFLFAAITVAANWTNMLAGFNGLESGMGIIMLFFLALNTQAQNTQLILLVYAAALAGFLLFNKYPAKIFPGDAGTLPVGVVLVGATFLGAPFYKLAILFMPHAVDALLKFTSFGIMSSAITKPTEIKNGFLVVNKNPWGKSYLSLSRAILSIKPLREWELVLIIWVIEIILGMVTLAI